MEQLDPAHGATSPTSVTTGSIELPAQIGALLAATAEALDYKCVWLGDEGLFGVHFLRRGPNGVEAIRIVETEEAGDSDQIRSGAGRWQEILGTGPVGGLLFARNLRVKGGGRSWVEVERGATIASVTRGVAWIPVDPCRDVPEVCRRLELSGR